MSKRKREGDLEIVDADEVIVLEGVRVASPQCLSAPKERATYAELMKNPYLRVLQGTLFSSTCSVQQTLKCFSDKTVAKQMPPLPPGVFHLPSFLSVEEQRALMSAADTISMKIPWEIPEVNRPHSGEPGFGNLYFAYSGSKWDGRKKLYFRSEDTPLIPGVVLALAKRAVSEALSQSPPSEPPPFPSPPFDCMNPEDHFTCLMNYYPRGWGTISEHSDSSEPNVSRGHPVVSFSVGDEVSFIMRPEMDGFPNEIEVVLKSGDVVIFGGRSRKIKHAIPKPPKGVRPVNLGMVPGRLNCTLRAL